MLISGVRIIDVTSSPLSRTRGAFAGDEVDARARGEILELRFIVRVDAFARGGERERAIHRAGVDVRDAELARDERGWSSFCRRPRGRRWR